MWGELRPLDDQELRTAEENLLDEGLPVLDLMAAVGLHQVPEAGPAAEKAQASGWLDAQLRPTMIGSKIADSCREFKLWEERGRAMPLADTVDEVRVEAFEGLDVVELGSGFGCNLLSLSQSALSVTGIEIEPVYGQLAPILARRAGLAAPRVLQAGADATGLPAASVDRVLIVGAMQYMPIPETLKEMQRILRPGGMAYAFHSHFGGHLELLGEIVKTRGRIPAREVINLAGMMLYPYIGRAIMRPSDHVYPTHRWMARWARDAGLETVHARVLGRETFYAWRRPA